jgi:hypothetical protein
VKAWKYLLPVPIVAALAMVPQDPPAADANQPDLTHIVTMSDLHYVNLSGTATTLSARNVVEVRFLENQGPHIRLELLYENGDYSLLDVQAFHVLRNGSPSRDVRLVRGQPSRMRFPKLP